jgi:hypothetical protein
MTVEVATLRKHIAQRDADAQHDPALFGQAGIALGECPLHVQRRAHRVDSAREFAQCAVAGDLEDAPAMRARPGLEHVGAQSLEGRQRACLVALHQARVADHIGRQDCREVAL